MIAGLAARGTTTINRVYHLDRGYERIEKNSQPAVRKSGGKKHDAQTAQTLRQSCRGYGYLISPYARWVSMMAFLDDQRRVVLVMNRFAELPEANLCVYEVHYKFSSIVNAQRRNIRTDQPDGVLSLLALRFEALDAPAGTVSIIFGGGEIRNGRNLRSHIGR